MKKKILNLTQHAATPEQIAAGVYEPKDKEAVKKLLTFDELPSEDDIWERARGFVDNAIIGPRSKRPKYAMIGGAPYLMLSLDLCLRRAGITPLYSFTKREVVEVPGADGSVVKTAVFKHVGWVKMETE